LKDILTNSCATDTCATSDCCDTNPTCDNIDGTTGTDFASCISGINHLKDTLTNSCATDTCATSDCCDTNPTCDNIDGSGADFSSCVAGTNYLKDDLTGTCATATCTALDCCNAVAEESGPSPSSLRADESGPSPSSLRADESGPSPSSTSETVVADESDSLIILSPMNIVFIVLAVITGCASILAYFCNRKRTKRKKLRAMRPAIAMAPQNSSLQAYKRNLQEARDCKTLEEAPKLKETKVEKKEEEEDKEKTMGGRTFTQLLVDIQDDSKTGSGRVKKLIKK